jgi:hypothetical protein
MLLDPRIKDYPGFEEFEGLKLWWAAELDAEDICQRCGVPWMVHGSPLYPWCPDGSRRYRRKR